MDVAGRKEDEIPGALHRAYEGVAGNRLRVQAVALLEFPVRWAIFSLVYRECSTLFGHVEKTYSPS